MLQRRSVQVMIPTRNVFHNGKFSELNKTPQPFIKKDFGRLQNRATTSILFLQSPPFYTFTTL